MTAAPTADSAETERQLRTMLDRDFDFVWLALRRLGVRESEVEDAVQKVFLVVIGKVGSVEAGCERAFLFQTALRIAANARRGYRRARAQLDESACDVDCSDPTPAPDELLEQKRLREGVDQILDAMPIQLRAVLVLYEVDQKTVPEIASLLGLRLGTAASRLRRAREAFMMLADRFAGISARQGDDSW